MRRFGLMKFAACLLALVNVLTASSAMASVLSSHLTFDGIPDTIDDDSRSEFADVDGDGFVSVGDIAYGYISVSDFTPTGTASPDEIATVFSVAVTGVIAPTLFNPGGGFALGPTPLGGAFSLDTLLGPAFVLANPGILPVGSIGVVVDLSGVDPLVPEVADPAGAGALGAPFPGIWELTVGFSSVAVPDSTGAVNPADFFEISPGPGSPAPTTPRFERAGLSVLAFGAFPTLPFIPVPVGHLDLVTVTSHDITLYSGNISPNPAGPLGIPPGSSTWGFVDDSDFRANVPVPEPVAMLIWGFGIIVGAGLVGVRRRPLAG